MSVDLLQPPSALLPAEALRLSQQASRFLKSQGPSIVSLPYPISLLTDSESQEKWQVYENLLLACLRTGDDESAYLCLQGLRARFGEKNERVQALQGLYNEATASDDAELEVVLKQYEEILADNPANFPIRKRRAALLRSMGKTADAITALTGLVDASPIDAESWSELADLYLTQGLYSQAIYCLEEVVLITPNAWNLQARMGETLYLSANATEGTGEQLKMLSEAMRRYCRSVELCNDYLRGYYGLKVTTTRLLQLLSTTSKGALASSNTAAGDLAPPSLSAVQRLNELATSKLAEMLRRNKAREKGWDGYDHAELVAARALLDRDTQQIQR